MLFLQFNKLCVAADIQYVIEMFKMYQKKYKIQNFISKSLSCGVLSGLALSL